MIITLAIAARFKIHLLSATGNEDIKVTIPMKISWIKTLVQVPKWVGNTWSMTPVNRTARLLDHPNGGQTLF